MAYKGAVRMLVKFGSVNEGVAIDKFRALS